MKPVGLLRWHIGRKAGAAGVLGRGGMAGFKKKGAGGRASSGQPDGRAKRAGGHDKDHGLYMDAGT